MRLTDPKTKGTKMGKNRLCELLGIRYPIVQAPMNWVSGAELTAAVSNAGGLGTLGPNAGADSIVEDVEITGERMREQIRKVKGLTDKPFAVNIVVGFGELLAYSQRTVEVMIDERVPVAVVSVGRPDVYTKVLQDAGIKVLHAISTARHAKKAEEAGVDGVLCEGYESGGHKGLTELTTLVLTPMVADVVKIPVVAGGGIADARGVLAAMALGADGVYMGTRFMATREAESHQRVKESIVNGKDACTVSISKGFMLARDLRNGFTQKYMELQEAGDRAAELMELTKGAQFRAQHLGEAEDAEICCGQGAGLIDAIGGAGEVIESITGNLRKRLDQVRDRMEGLA
jgi:NAD(P)H-dependent flavin oxidoreductase YrpB (nitropropane dioxygenase family)